MPLNRQYFLNYKSKHYIFLSIIIFFIHFSSESQIKSKIKFQSANPFAMSDVINNPDKPDPQEVFGELTIPSDSINNEKKYPLIIAVAGSLGWRKHHYDYLDMYQKNYLNPNACISNGLKVSGRPRFFSKEFFHYYLRLTLNN